MKKIILGLFLVFCILRPGFAQLSDKTEYRINPKDILEISVYEEPDLCKTVKVNLEGKIAYPLLGNITVGGLTVRETEGMITKLLAQDYLVNPQVVEVVVKDSVKISVLGKVARPGSYELKSSLTILDAIIQAGGLSDQTAASDVKVVRLKGDTKKTINVDLDNIISKDNKQLNIRLEPNDLIMVGGISATNAQIVLFGEVRKAGIYPYTKGMTVIEAVALAGGLNEMAAADGTKIIREKGDKREVIRVPLGSILKGGNREKDIDLEPNDAVVVPQSFF